MFDMELFKQNLEAYKASDNLSEQNKLLKELKDIVKDASLTEKKEILKLALSAAVDDLFR